MTDPREQAIAARLTAIAERLKAADDAYEAYRAATVQISGVITDEIQRQYRTEFQAEADAEGVRERADMDLAEHAMEDIRFLSAHIETLTQQVADLTATLKEQAFEQTFADLRRAEQARDAAHAALREYGRHKTGCAARKWPPGKFACTCGLDAALAASAPQKAQVDELADVVCPQCGHPHKGRAFAYICIGCPCDWRPGASGIGSSPPAQETER